MAIGRVRALSWMTALVVCLVDPTDALAAPGDLDPTFGTGGIVVTPIQNNDPADDEANAVAIASDGAIVTAGFSTLSFPFFGSTFQMATVLTYSPEGTAGDPTIALWVRPGGGSGHEIARGVAVQDDGKIVVAGSSATTGHTDIMVARFAAGELDDTFGTDGGVIVNLGPSSEATAVMLQPDGKILVTGWSDAQTTLVLMRLDADGVLDPSFGTAGIAMVPGEGTALALQPDGKIVVVGGSVVARFDDDGSLDTTFGGDGVVDAPSDSVGAVAVDPDGNVVVAGGIYTSTLDIIVARYLPNGTLDATFGTGGIVVSDFGSQDIARGIAVQTDGKIVVVGSRVVRYLTDGTLDPEFGVAGSTDAGFTDRLAGALQTDGRIVVAGFVRTGRSQPGAYGPAFAVARYLIGTCGNGILEGGEECDDANLAGGDGCDGYCRVEAAPTPTPTPTSTPPSTPFPTATATPTPPGCGTIPDAGCRQPTAPLRSSLLLKDRIPDSHDLLTWKWTHGAATLKAAFGNPLAGTGYALCLYDGIAGIPTLRLAAAVPAGGICAKGRPCWRESTHGFKYLDKDATPDGVTVLALKEGLEGAPQILLKARGAQLPIPALPLTQGPAVTVQLKNTLGNCWEAHYGLPSIRNQQAEFRDKSD